MLNIVNFIHSNKIYGTIHEMWHTMLISIMKTYVKVISKHIILALSHFALRYSIFIITVTFVLFFCIVSGWAAVYKYFDSTEIFELEKTRKTQSTHNGIVMFCVRTQFCYELWITCLWMFYMYETNWEIMYEVLAIFSIWYFLLQPIWI